MQGAFIGLLMLCAVGMYVGGPKAIVEHPGEIVAAAQHNAEAVLTFARKAFDDVPDLKRRMSACAADVASAACNEIR